MAPRGEGYLGEVVSLSDTDVWVRFGRGIPENWDGHEWRPTVVPGRGDIIAMAFPSTHRGWGVGGAASGQEAVFDWNGSSWAMVSIRQTGLRHGLSGRPGPVTMLKAAANTTNTA